MNLLPRLVCSSNTTVLGQGKVTPIRGAIVHGLSSNSSKGTVRHRSYGSSGSLGVLNARPLHTTRQLCFSSASASSSQSVEVSEDDVRRYEEDGAVVVRQLFSREWIEKLRDAAEVNMQNPGPLCDEHVPPGQPGRFHDDQFLWMRHDTMYKFLFESPAGEIARRMARAKEVRLFYDQLFVKEPGTQTITPWHNDHSYWPLNGDQIVSLWLALDHVPKSACVQYVKGSHKWKLMHKLQSFGEGNEERYKDANLESLPDMPDIDSRLDEVELLTWDLEPGDCLVHHSFAVHGASGISESGNRRRAYATRWVGDAVTFDPRPGKNRRLVQGCAVNDEFCISVGKGDVWLKSPEQGFVEDDDIGV